MEHKDERMEKKRYKYASHRKKGHKKGLARLCMWQYISVKKLNRLNGR
jgi:hypothetical protein